MINWIDIASLITMVVGFIVIGLKLFQIGEWKGTVDAEISSLNKLVQKLEKQIGNIYDYLLSTKTTERGSPIRLTEFGREIAEDLNIYEWAEKNAYPLWDTVEDMEDYEIHDFCFDFIDELSSDNTTWENFVRRIAYDRGIKKQDIYDVYAVVLRDEILNKRGEGTDLSTTE